MLIQCANCRSYFSNDELSRGKPPLHPWKLTATGQKALQANEAIPGFHPQCPSCGQRTLTARASG